MTEYEGQPDYVVVAYLNDLFTEWADECGNDEWGEYMYNLRILLGSCLSVSDEKHAKILAEWFQEELTRAFDENWWCTRADRYEDWQSVYYVQDKFKEITEEWRQRAKAFKAESALENTIAHLPEWFGPMPNRFPKPDPDRALYERLKAKFEPDDA